MSVGKRLKEERKRLGLTQEEIAVQLDVSRYAQLNFEKDINLPGGAYLLAALGRGVDVMYVLTGQRAQLEATEAALVAAFRDASESARAEAMATLGVVPRQKPARAGIKVAFGNSEIGQVNTVGGDLHQDNSFSVGGKKKRS
ncbi:MAG TPA: helix-turn-helix transcriptional regulator [Stenotrophomonas sp.]|nr:helix-turn-helix transcriptional regulator [Stenotrophomonas sp.]